MISPVLKFDSRPTKHKIVCATRDNYVLVTRLVPLPSVEAVLESFMTYVETLPLHYLDRVVILFDEGPESDFRRRVEADWAEARARLHHAGLN